MLIDESTPRLSMFCDWECNRGRQAIRILLVSFRLGGILRGSNSTVVRVVGLVASAIYRLLGLFVFSIDIPTRTKIGAGLSIHHGFGLVVHADSKIGDGVVLRQGVTIGSNGRGAPVIGDCVDVGASALIIGTVTVGCNATIGAGSVVVKDIGEGKTVVGNPAREI